MTDRTFASVVSRVSPHLPGCPQPLMLNTIREAAIRACETTLAWRYQLPLFDLEPGVFRYYYNKPDNTDVHVIFRAIHDNEVLEQLTLDEALAKYPEWADLYNGLPAEDVWVESPGYRFNLEKFNTLALNAGGDFTLSSAATAGAGEPKSICQLTPDQFIILPLPGEDKAFTMRMFVALKPKRDAIGMRAVVMDELEDVIYHDVLKQLYAMPKEQVNWADYELASWHAKHLTFKLAERRARANLGNARGMMRAKFVSFGA